MMAPLDEIEKLTPSKLLVCSLSNLKAFRLTTNIYGRVPLGFS